MFESFLEEWLNKDPDDFVDELGVTTEELCRAFEDRLYEKFLRTEESDDERSS